MVFCDAHHDASSQQAGGGVEEAPPPPRPRPLPVSSICLYHGGICELSIRCSQPPSYMHPCRTIFNGPSPVARCFESVSLANLHFTEDV